MATRGKQQKKKKKKAPAPARVEHRRLDPELIHRYLAGAVITRQSVTKTSEAIAYEVAGGTLRMRLMWMAGHDARGGGSYYATWGFSMRKSGKTRDASTQAKALEQVRDVVRMMQRKLGRMLEVEEIAA